MFRYKTTATLGAALLAIVLAVDTIAFTQIVASSPGKKLRAATPQEMKILTDQMKNMLSRSADDLSVVRHPDGSESMDLQGRFMNLSVAKVNSDGSVSTECATTVSEAKRFLASDASSSTRRAKTKRSPVAKRAAMEEK